MKPIGEVVDEFLAPVAPLPIQHVILCGQLFPVDPKSGPIRRGDKYMYNSGTGMVEKLPEN